jgi:hypothetical protein
MQKRLAVGHAPQTPTQPLFLFFSFSFPTDVLLSHRYIWTQSRLQMPGVVTHHSPTIHPPLPPLPLAHVCVALAAPRHWSIPLTREQQNRLACGSCSCVALGGGLVPGRPPACPWLMHCTPPGVVRQVVPLPGACRLSAALSHRCRSVWHNVCSPVHISLFSPLSVAPHTRARASMCHVGH